MSFDRAESLSRLSSETFDVLVIGGGITGAGIALDAASRGLSAALVERDDFSSGTSSKSSKLVHGGLRYLQNGDVRLVYEALHERQRLRRNAPHLVRLLPFLIPILGKGGVVNPKIARALGSAMWMYDLTGGARIGKLHKRLKATEVLEYMPTLPTEHVAGGYLYYDAQTDDSRLTLTVLRTAAERYGAVVANGARVVGVVKGGDGRAIGASIAADGATFDVRASAVVNATGVWSDDVRALDEGAHPGSIRPAKGIHVTVPWAKVRNKIAVVVPVPKDKRSVFVVPWGELTYIGTTDTDYDGPVDDPQCTADDIDYVLRAINASVSGGGISHSDVLGTWAGLRPLVRSASSGRTADLSRRHLVAQSASGVVSVTGGKLTTYREMAEDAVDIVVKRLGDAAPAGAKRCHTRRLPLLGAEGYDAMTSAAGSDATKRHLADRYGGEAGEVLALMDSESSLAEPLVAGLPYVRAEAVYAARREMVRSVDDVLARRTRARLLARDASAAAAHDVAMLIAPELGWTPVQAAASADEYRSLVAHERTAPGLPETALA